MTIKDAERIIAKTTSPCLKRDMRRYIQRQKRKEAQHAGSETTNRRDPC